MADPITSTFGLLAGGKNLLSVEAPPGLQSPPTMPLPDDEAMRKARRQSYAKQRARGGRASTLLTADTLG